MTCLQCYECYFLVCLVGFCLLSVFFFFFFNDTATTEIYTLSLHDALPIWAAGVIGFSAKAHELCLVKPAPGRAAATRSEEHTSELQSPCNLVCRLLLEKKKHKALRTLHATLRHAHVLSDNNIADSAST